MNTAIDRTIAVDRLAFDDRTYILSSKDSPGGRGINAARVIHSFGGDTLAIFPAGGERGIRFETYMQDCGFPVANVPIHHDIRLNLTITDRHGLTVKLNELGPRLDRGELASVQGTVEAQLGRASWLMLCGSLPPGVPADFYAQLIVRAAKKGVKTLLDADGEALSQGIEAGPSIVTPNQQEAERLLNTVLLTRSHSLAAARRILSMGAQTVVLSLGSRGAIGAVASEAGNQLWEATPPRVDAISPIGAGDALAAALTWSLANGDDFQEALRWGVAAGSASAKLPGVNFASLEQTREVYADVDLRRVESVSPEADTGSHPGLLKSAGIVSAGVMTSRITGLVRESVLSWLFGASATYDAYVLGYRIPNLARELFAEGALSSAFVPTFTRYLATRSHEEARELSNITATVLILVVGAFCTLGMFLSPAIVDLFAPGFHAVSGKWELAVSLVRIMFPFLLLLALAAQAQGILHASHQFAVPAVSPSLFNVGSVLFGLALGYWLGPIFGISPIRGMAFGVVIGGAAQLVFQLPAVWRAGFGWRPRWNLRHEGVGHILGLMGPAVIGNASGQINVLDNTNFAAGLRDASGHVMNGPVSWLSYAYRFFMLPLGIFGVAIASAALPRISRSAAVRNFAEFREIFERSIVTILLLTIPSSVGLSILGESMIGIVYQHGKFRASDTHQTALALSCYAVGLAGYAALKLIAPAFYALGDSRTPMLVSMASVLVNAVGAFTMVTVFGFGHAGLAFTASVASTFTSLTLLFLLQSKIGGLGGRRIVVSFGKIVCAAAAMGLACKAVVLVSHAFLGARTLSKIADVTIGIPLGAAAFYAAAAALHVSELEEARNALLARFRRAS